MRLKPTRGLKVDTSNQHDWATTGDYPSFELKFLLIPRGWVLINLSMSMTHGSFFIPKLYCKIGETYNEDNSYQLPLNDQWLCKRLIYIPWTTRRLRLDPIDGLGSFSIKKISFKVITQRTAYKYLAYELQKHPRYYKCSIKKILRSLKKESETKKIEKKTVALMQYDELFRTNSKSSSFSYWINNSEQEKWNSEQTKKCLDSLRRKPLISVILPTYNTPLHYLKACIDSVLNQSYPFWELCIADDASSQSELIQLLQGYAAKYPQIKLVLHSENSHISATSNSALSLAKGEFVAMLDHDDLLAPHALLAVAEKIAHNSTVRLLYSDEDKIDAYGERSRPYFKPAWNPELLRGQNYICHLCVYQRDLLNQLGGFKKGLEGAQDWDLALRATEQLQPNQIEHIPDILYHWRAISGSTALAVSEKNYILSASKKALENHLQRVGLNATISPTKGSHWRIKLQLPKNPPLVSLLIPTHNGIEILKPCIESILKKTDYPDYEIIIINNKSDDPKTLHFLKVASKLAKVKVILDSGPFNYSAINNRAINKAKGSVLAFVNNDIEPINSDWLSEMVSEAMQPQTGAVGAMLYYPNNRVQHAGVVLGIAGRSRLFNGVAGHAFKNFPRGHSGQMNRMRLRQNYSAVTAACLLVRREVFERVGGFNETDLPISFNDVDLCLQIRAAGYRNIWTPFAELFHHESASRGTEDTKAKKERAKKEIEYMRNTWGTLLDNDPAYNPHLTLIHEDFSIGR